MPISTFKLVQHFGKLADFNVHVILPAEGELSKRIRQCDVQLEIIPFYRLRSPKRLSQFIRFLFFFPISFLKILLYLRKNDISVIHFSDVIDLPFYPVGLLAKAKQIAHLRHCIENFPARVFFKLFASLFIDKVVCISLAVLHYAGLSGNKVKVVYNPGPNLLIFNPERTFSTPSGLPQKSALIITIGKFLHAKGHEHFIEMAHYVESKHPGLCRFVILGNKFPAHEQYFFHVQNLIKKYDLNGSLTILDQVAHEEIPAILSSCKIYVHLPNWHEGLGGAILEAMAMQLPVVAFDCGGINECFTSGVSGFLVDQFDVKGAADRVMQLMDNEELRSRFGKAARKELLAKFSYEKHFSEIERTYRSLI
jgi:glycosyltransferase involved in cell wall biosynthesis